ncbi:MAG: hypothetical protein DMG41_00650 [Acidobacteria bacterium]|nr:MAG: hypothetical protein DMG41_00650 [Acidobacteriota bacterium]
MNTLIANQYGRVEGEAARNALTLSVTAQTPRREPVQLQTCIDSVEQQLHLLAILRAVERRIEQFQLRDAKTAQTGDQESPFDETICSEGDLFNSNGSSSKNKIYGRFSQFLVYEQVDQGRLRVFFAVRDEAKRVARFDLHPGEVQAMHALAKRALFACQQVDLLLRDDLSLSVALNVSSHGLRLEVQTPLWHSQFVISKGNDLATLAVFIRRAINQEKTIPIRFEDAGIQFGLRKRNDGQVLAEFHHDESMERIPLSTLQLYELEILAQFALHRAFEPPSFAAGNPLSPETATAA